MEDSHAAISNLDEGKGDDESNAFFAVYDGHGGSSVARFAGQNVHKRLVTEEAYKAGDYEQALKRAFLGTDEDLLANPSSSRDPSGCTAVAALITRDNKIYVANAGDSRSVIGTKGVVKPLSFDHKPTSETERARISGAGGYIEYGRVNGNLALSRALGDFEFKKNYALPPERQIITADPDVTCHEITEDDEFLVIACDGIWDCLTSQQVIDFVRYKVYEGKPLEEIGEMMCDHCLAPDTSSGAGIGCDNMTVLIIAITHGRTKEEWYAWVKDRVERKVGFETPSQPPQLYAQSRLATFRARQEALAARDRQHPHHPQGVSDASSILGNDDFLRRYGLTVSTLGGGISFRPNTGLMAGGGSLMFANDDSDEEESEEELGSGRSFFTETLGLGAPRPDSPDATDNLKAQLEEFEKNINSGDLDEDGDSQMGDPEDEKSSKVETDSKLQGEAPPPPKLPNGNAIAEPVEQITSPPSGDAPDPVSKVEGLLDKSEDPLKN
ncbi:hypothetical protein MD484_g1232, partial [Candolleomyces efflorescens]